jgi:pyruvate dehydrogenase E2 component (dihydrolipoamide acetyltransferase)
MIQRRERLSGIQKKTAEKMCESVRIIPHVTTIREINMSEVVKMKTELSHKFEKLTYMPFILCGVVAALKEFPIVNARLEKDEIVYTGNLNIGIAVSVGEKLLVPNLKDLQEKSFEEIVTAVNNLSERARSKKLTPDDFQEGTFTVSNSGAFGGDIFTPIINYPESAILGVGIIKKKPIVNKKDEIMICPMMHACLSYDHRIINGSTAVQFLGAIDSYLQKLPDCSSIY